MKIINLTKETLLADKVILANTPFSRIKGLLGKQSLGGSEALIIEPCNSIHTFFMRFAIDVLFLDSQGKVVGIKENMPPFRLSRIYPKAKRVVELPPPAINQSRTCLNDQVVIEP